MEEFPAFMRRPENRVRQSSQYTQDVEGYVFDGAEGSQVACWTCARERESSEHAHDYDEYLVCVHGTYTIIMDGVEHPLHPGDELHIPAGVAHRGRCVAGTRTIHAFGGRRAEREASPLR
jgi:quercetin dioxygenase-like cupin family protein